MKVIAINGSPNSKGNTYQSLELVSEVLRINGIEVETIHVGNKAIRGCMSCGKCSENQNEKCIMEDGINEIIQKIKEADGLIIGSPVYFSGIAGTMKSFLDRLFYVSHVNGNLLHHKVGASVVVLRRSGGVATFDALNHYLQFAQILMPTSNYWNVIHGNESGEVQEDQEGIQIMKLLGEDMAWLLKLVDYGKTSVAEPKKQDKLYMNFFR